jgi:hypothetical protein
MILVLPVPDLSALERAGAAFAQAPSVETQRAVAAALQAFSERAELLALYVARVCGKPKAS